MEEVKLFFFLLASFFGIENGQILSEWNKLRYLVKADTGLRKEMKGFIIESFNLKNKNRRNSTIFKA
tara:strand:- start:607 stop:807 length:201 start_codon:yes stop_codon:yes gene_type:complete